jgi:hypothetical protein
VSFYLRPERIRAHKRVGWYANSGSWISAASVAELRARGVGWDRLSPADRSMFPAKNVALTESADLGVIGRHMPATPDRGRR